MSRPRKDYGSSIYEIETHYITDPARRSVEWWFTQLPKASEAIPLQAFRQFAEDNKWYFRRQDYWRGVQAAWLKQAQINLIQTKTDELKDTLELRSQVFKHCRPVVQEDGTEVWPIKPSSLDGLLRCFVQLTQLADTQREGIAEMMDPLLARVNQELAQSEEEEKAADGSDLPFDKQEMRLLAHNMLKMRRKNRRKQLGIEDDEDDPIIENTTDQDAGPVDDQDRLAGKG
jgi:hypothetical protein